MSSLRGSSTRCSCGSKCGNRGCAETVASGRALSEAVAARGGIAIEDVFTECADESFVQDVLDHAADAVASEINILDPEAMLLGGGVVQMNGFPRKHFEALVRERSRKPVPAETLRFLYSSKGDHNGVLGAGLAAWQDCNN